MDQIIKIEMKVDNEILTAFAEAYMFSKNIELNDFVNQTVKDILIREVFGPFERKKTTEAIEKASADVSDKKNEVVENTTSIIEGI